jgi:1,4-dihydroxy-2-naphthoate octaprenyltransferase
MERSSTLTFLLKAGKLTQIRLQDHLQRTVNIHLNSKWRSLVYVSVIATISFWIGVFLGPANGFAINMLLSVLVNLGLLLILGGILYVNRSGPEWVVGLFLGLLPVMLGYYLQSHHWSSELFLFGLVLSFTGFNLFLSHNWANSRLTDQDTRQSLIVRLGPVACALIYTLVNILIIIGLVLCLLFPAAPLPFHQGLWFSIILAVICQELIKRRQYREPQGQRLLEGLTFLTSCSIGLFFLLSTWGRV